MRPCPSRRIGASAPGWGSSSPGPATPRRSGWPAWGHHGAGGRGRRPAPFTVLLERRVAERLFLTFQGAASYGASQDDTNADLKGHLLDLEGALGVRRVFNPGGVIEVSWFGNAGFGYTNSESRYLTTSYDSTTGAFTLTTLQIIRSHTFSVGAVTGITLERQLIEGLALRLSSSIVGVSYGLGATTATTPDTKTDRQTHQFDAGLRFSPSIELRYAF